MKTSNLTTANIIETKWRNCSIYGNSSYWVTFRDTKTDNVYLGYTAPNAACGYGVRNYGPSDIVYIQWHETTSGKIVIDDVESEKGRARYEAAHKANFIKYAKKISRNSRRNALLNSICDDILAKYENYNEGHSGLLRELKRYYADFRRELDYNYAQYGNLLIYHTDVRELYKKCGYSASSIDKLTDNQLWRYYLAAVGEVVRFIINHENDII